MAQLAITTVQIVLLLAILMLLLLRRRGSSDETITRVAELRMLMERFDPTVREETRALRSEMSAEAQQARTENAADSRALREELLATVNSFGSQVSQGISDSRQEQAQAASQLRESVSAKLDRLISTVTGSNESLREALQSRGDALVQQVTGQLSEMRSEQSQAGAMLKESVQTALVALGGELRDTNKQLSLSVQERLGEATVKVGELTGSNEQKLETIRQLVATQLADLRTQQLHTGEQLTESVQSSFSRLSNDLRETDRQLNEAMQERLVVVANKIAELTAANERSQESSKGSNEILRETLQHRVDTLVQQVSAQFSEMRSEQSQTGGLLKESVQTALVALGGELRDTNKQLSLSVQERLGEASAKVSELTASNDQKLEVIRQHVASQLTDLRTQQVHSGEQLTESVQTSFGRLANDLRETSRQLSEAMQQRLIDVANKTAELAAANEKSQESLRGAVEERLQKLNESNSQKLEEIRQTVDEKLHSTLEKRLTDSFGLVTEQLGNVQRGLGEMKDLANGVGDLKRVLTNIKSRGGYGEVQLEMLIDQMLSPEQYVKNAHIGQGTQQTVEFAIKLPGQATGEPVLLPVDAKFPREAWDRLDDAQDRGDQEAVKQAREKLESTIRFAAKEISEKYVLPPTTTPFAVMFLPTEGLFAEVVRRAGLVDELQSKYRVTVAGPTTFAALLTSLQMGFRTLAIQKKGSEVWKVLAATKLEFEKFGGLMDRVEKNIGTVQNTLRDVGTRTRAISRTLKNVETVDLQPGEPTVLLGLADTPGADGDEPGPVALAS